MGAAKSVHMVVNVGRLFPPEGRMIFRQSASKGTHPQSLKAPFLGKDIYGHAK